MKPTDFQTQSLGYLSCDGFQSVAKGDFNAAGSPLTPWWLLKNKCLLSFVTTRQYWIQLPCNQWMWDHQEEEEVLPGLPLREVPGRGHVERRSVETSLLRRLGWWKEHTGIDARLLCCAFLETITASFNDSPDKLVVAWAGALKTAVKPKTFDS